MSKWNVNPSVPVPEESEEIEGVDQESTEAEPHVSTDFTKIDWSWTEKGRELQHYNEVYQNAYKEMQHYSEKYRAAYNEYRSALLKVYGLLDRSLLEIRQTGTAELLGLHNDCATVNEFYTWLEDDSKKEEVVDDQGNE